MTSTPLARASFRRVALLGAAGALALAACKGKSDVADAVSADWMDMKPAAVADRDIEARLDVDAPRVDAASAEAALARLGLDAPGTALRWGERDGADGSYTFSDVELLDESGEVRGTISGMELLGLRTVGEDGVAVTRAEFDDISLMAEEARFEIDDLVMIEPRADDLARVLDADDADLELPDVEALSLSGLSVTDTSSPNAAGRLTLASLAFADASEPTASDGLVRLSDLAFTGEGGGNTPMSFTLDSIDVSGLRSLDAINPGMIGELADQVGNSVDMPFDAASIGEARMSADTFRMVSNGLVARMDKNDDTTVSRLVMDDIVFSFDGAPSEPALSSVHEAFQGLGYERFVMRAAGRTVLDEATDTATSEGGYFEIEDGLRVEIDSTILGTAAMRDAVQARIAQAGPAPGPDADEDTVRIYQQTVAEAGMSSLDMLKLGAVEMRIDDNSLVERIFEMVGQQQGSSPKVLRAQAKSMLMLATMTGAGASVGVDNAVINEVATAVGEWIDSPGSELVISLAPAEPIAFTDAQDGLTQERLGLSATVEK